MRLIDADALLKHEVESDRIRGVLLVVPKGFILDAKTIDAAPVVHAYWEGHFDEDLNRGDWRICTACGHDEWGKAENGSNYCPACGARMDADRVDAKRDAPERVGEGEDN
jgi:predicted RNA-binding Zn-ribbon protein involved in translation (DUF1610 family)